MKQFLFLVFAVIISGSAMAQDSSTVKSPASTDSVSATYTESLPEFVGDREAFLSKHLVYPRKANRRGEQGRVVVQFVVEEDGSISDIRIVRSVSRLLDEEAMRVVRLMPRWIPGKQNGVPVKVQYTLPITFRLDD